MPNPTVVATGSTGVDDINVASHSVSKPASVQAGDLAIGLFIEWSSSATFPVLTLPAGSTLVKQATIVGSMNGGNDRATVWAKVVGAEVLYAAESASACWGGHHVIFVRDWDNTQALADLFTSLTNRDTGATSLPAIGLGTLVAGDLAVGIYGNDNDGSGITHTPPTDFVEKIDAQGAMIAVRENVPGGTMPVSGGSISASTSALAIGIRVKTAGGGGGGEYGQFTVTKWASDTPQTVATTWANTTNANGTNNGTEATWVNAARRTVGSISLGGYGLQTDIGTQPDSIDDVAVTIYHRENNTTNIATVTAQLFDGATAIGSPTALSRSTTATSQTINVSGVTWAQLANLRVKIESTRANTTTSTTQYVDAASVAVTYTRNAPPTEADMICGIPI